VTLTPEERHRIVHLRLDGMTVRAVAEETGHAPNTVTKAWRLHMAESASVRREDIDAQREEIAQRLEMAAHEAREAGEEARKARDWAGHVRYLREEREALRVVARLTGIDRPLAPPSSAVSLQDHVDARERLAEYVQSIAEQAQADARGVGYPQPD
jgi:transposase-like protein